MIFKKMLNGFIGIGLTVTVVLSSSNVVFANTASPEIKFTSWMGLEEGYTVETKNDEKEVDYKASNDKVEPVIMINGEFNLNCNAVIKNGHTLIQLRSIGDAIGAEISWNKEIQMAYIKKDGKAVSFKIGSDTMSVNGESKSIDAKAEVINSSTYIPLRAAGEALGAEIGYFNINKQNDINIITLDTSIPNSTISKQEALVLVKQKFYNDVYKETGSGNQLVTSLISTGNAYTDTKVKCFPDNLSVNEFIKYYNKAMVGDKFDPTFIKKISEYYILKMNNEDEVYFLVDTVNKKVYGTGWFTAKFFSIDEYWTCIYS